MDGALTALRSVWENNEPWTWGGALLTGLCVSLVALVTRRFVRQRYARMAETVELELMEIPLEIASKTSNAFVLALAGFAALSALTLPAVLYASALKLLTVVGFWQLGIWGSAAVLGWLAARRKASAEHDRAAAGSLGIIGFVLQILVWALVLLLMLDNVGVDITALVAGLGVGGIAVALAVQNVLGDLFASLSITLDRPFVIGDFVAVGDFLGSVEAIGVKSTRLRSLSGEQIVMSNADLLGSRVRNYGRMAERRIVFQIRVTYETSRAQLKRIPPILRECVERQPHARFDRAHFAKYGTFSLEFEIVFYVLSPEYGRYMDVQQAINLDIHEAFEREKIEFAYPTQRLWLSSADAQVDQSALLRRPG